SANGSSTNNDFAALLPASVSGFVYLDSNNNGVKDSGESGLPGATVTLTGTNDLGAAINIVHTTGADGSYQFTSSPPRTSTLTSSRPGTYPLPKAPLTGSLDGKDSLGTVGGALGVNSFSSVVLNSQSSGSNYNFGELLPVAPTGVIYADSFSMTSSSFDHPLD